MHTHPLFSKRTLSLLGMSTASIALSFFLGVQSAGDLQPFSSSEALEPDASVIDAIHDAGDVDGNGVLEIRDAILIFEFASDLSSPTASEFAAADLSGDLRVTNEDGLRLLHMLSIR